MNYTAFKTELTCTATGKTCKVRVYLTCKNDNVKYLRSDKTCKLQYVSSAFESNYKPRFRVLKSDMNA